MANKTKTKKTTVYKAIKVEKYFSLKSQTLPAVSPKITYKFSSCSRDVNEIYIDIRSYDI